MKNLFVFGDSHGDSFYVETMIDLAKRQGADYCVQLGDFGYWEHTRYGREYLDRVSKAAKMHNLNLYWIDGNHENHDMLKEMPASNRGLVKVRDSVYYLPRAHAWNWGGVRFMAMGGAFSVDFRARREGVSWWKDEIISDRDIYKAMNKGPIDVLLSHDCPLEVDLRLPRLDDYIENATHSNRHRLSEVVNLVKPKLIIHGHYHRRHTHVYEADFGDVKVEGFASNNELYSNPQDCYGMFSLKERENETEASNQE